MGQIGNPEKAFLFAGFIFREDGLYDEVRRKLQLFWGRIIRESSVRPFSYTDYYRKEMGEDLKRSFLVFDRLILPDELAAIKVETNGIEEEFSNEGIRRVNIDPGYLGLAKVVLASTKDFSHRIYLGKGIYGDLTLRFVRGSFHPLEWTYPDYREVQTINFLNEARGVLLGKLKQ